MPLLGLAQPWMNYGMEKKSFAEKRVQVVAELVVGGLVVEDPVHVV